LVEGQASLAYFFWLLHFGDLRPKEAKCEGCEDYKMRACKGGKDPRECMIEKRLEQQN
jgi:hypothetical protein